MAPEKKGFGNRFLDWLDTDPTLEEEIDKFSEKAGKVFHKTLKGIAGVFRGFGNMPKSFLRGYNNTTVNLPDSFVTGEDIPEGEVIKPTDETEEIAEEVEAPTPEETLEGITAEVNGISAAFEELDLDGVSLEALEVYNTLSGTVNAQMQSFLTQFDNIENILGLMANPLSNKSDRLDLVEEYTNNERAYVFYVANTAPALDAQVISVDQSGATALAGLAGRSFANLESLADLVHTQNKALKEAMDAQKADRQLAEANKQSLKGFKNGFLQNQEDVNIAQNVVSNNLVLLASYWSSKAQELWEASQKLQILTSNGVETLPREEYDNIRRLIEQCQPQMTGESLAAIKGAFAENPEANIMKLAGQFEGNFTCLQDEFAKFSPEEDIVEEVDTTDEGTPENTAENISLGKSTLNVIKNIGKDLLYVGRAIYQELPPYLKSISQKISTKVNTILAEYEETPETAA